MNHFSTLRSGDKVLWRWVISGYIAPLALGFAAWFGHVRVGALGEIISGSSILAGFLFALVIFIFELRTRITDNPAVQQITRLPELVDQLFSNTVYAVAVALVLTCVTVFGAVTEPHSKAGVPLGAEVWLSALIVALGVHLMVTVVMCLQRTNTAYRELRT